MNNILKDRKYNIDGGWYAPARYLRDFDSVIAVHLSDTTSSAGDWQGYFVQKIGEVRYLILFFQENNYPRGGFTLTTGDVVATSYGAEFDEDEIYSILNDLMEAQ